MSSIKKILFGFTPHTPEGCSSITTIEQDLFGIPYIAAKEMGYQCDITDELKDFGYCSVKQVEESYLNPNEKYPDYDMVFAPTNIAMSFYKKYNNVIPFFVLKGYFPNTLFLSGGFSNSNIFTNHMPKFLSSLDEGYEFIEKWVHKSSEKLSNKRKQNYSAFERHINLGNSDTDKPFVFIPMQYSDDITIRCSNFDYLNHIISVAKLCKKYDMNLVIKLHPDAYEVKYGERDKVDKTIERCSSMCNVIIDFGDIRELLKKAVVTFVASNESIIMDACVVKANIIACAPHMFMRTDAVLQDKNEARVFEKFTNNKIKCNYKSQNKLLWWSRNWLLFDKDECTYNSRIYIDRMMTIFRWIENKYDMSFLFGVGY